MQTVAEGHIAGRVLCSAGVNLAINQAHIGDPQRARRQNTEPRKCGGVKGAETEKTGHIMSQQRSRAAVFLSRLTFEKKKSFQGKSLKSSTPLV